ncbi:EAL domain-containing protein [Domibacillus sp.]|uniref:EAL domain-containing protein n=1 Tax=Domibacillus sp. TaxID=1969783 RepID=UPI0028111AEA|nr:EAL domain-containing protein [Domibacillus sp.]
MGIGIATMHYTGMAAMAANAIYRYHLGLFIWSIILAIFVSFIALYVFARLKKLMEKWTFKLVTALLMGVAVSSMHYTGMSAVTFFALPSAIAGGHADYANMNMLIMPVTAGMSFLLVLLLFSSILDRYIDYRISYFDGLTRLPNRRLFEKTLNKPAERCSLAIWHFDNLEQINQRYGYAFGEQVLQQVARTLREAHPGFTDLYRVDENRFAFLAPAVEPDILVEAMKTIALKWKEPIEVEEKWIELASVCSVSSVSGTDTNHQLYAEAMAVLEYPLLSYNHDVVLYDPAVHAFSFEQEILGGLTQAMEKDELFLVYQPKIMADTDRLAGFEALIRWRHSEHGMLSPGIFIPILEQHHRINELTDRVIDRASRQIAEWEKAGFLIKKLL